MGFSRQEYWRGLPFPSPGDLPDPGIEPVSPALAGGFLSSEAQGSPSLALGWVKRGVREATLTSLYEDNVCITLSTRSALSSLKHLSQHMFMAVSSWPFLLYVVYRIVWYVVGDQ